MSCDHQHYISGQNHLTDVNYGFTADNHCEDGASMNEEGHSHCDDTQKGLNLKANCSGLVMWFK